MQLPSLDFAKVDPGQRPRRDPQTPGRPPARRRESLVPRRLQERRAEPAGVRAPLRAPDVRGFGAFPGRFLQASSASGREHQRLDLERSHQLLRGHPHGASSRPSWRWSRTGWRNLLPALDESKLKIQKGVVKNEYRQNYANRPYGMVWPLMAEAMYPPQHPYNWLTIGVMEDLESASLDDVSAFFHRFYVPANASLAVVGDIDLDETMARVERYFGPIPGGTKALRPWVPAQEPRGGRDIVAAGPRRAGSVVHELAFGPPLPRRRRPARPARRHPGPGQGKPALPEAGDRPRDRPGCDGLPVGP